MKTQSWAILREFVQPNAAHVTTMMTLWKITTVLRSSSWNFLSLHYVIFYSPNSSNTTENVTFQVPFQGISWENIHFCGFLKKTYIANGRKIKVNSTKKYVKFLSSGYFFPSFISRLICSELFSLSCSWCLLWENLPNSKKSCVGVFFLVKFALYSMQVYWSGTLWRAFSLESLRPSFDGFSKIAIISHPCK